MKLNMIENDLITNAMKNSWYEKEYIECLIDGILPKIQTNMCIDVGANIGTFTLMIAKYFKKVLAFEFNPKPFQCLIKNMIDNGYTHVECRQIGLSYRMGFYTTDTEVNNIGATKILIDSFSLEHNGEENCFEVDCLDNQIDENDKVELMKLDIEGHELYALQGAEKIITKQKPVIVCEIMKRHFDKNNKCGVQDYLTSLGYDYRYVMVNDGKKQKLEQVEYIERKIHPMVVFSTIELI